MTRSELRLVSNNPFPPGANTPAVSAGTNLGGFIAFGGTATSPVDFRNVSFGSRATSESERSYGMLLPPQIAAHAATEDMVVMSNPSREEIDAKLAAAEARSETRFVELSGKIDRVIDSIAALNSNVAIQIGSVKSELGVVKAELMGVKADNKNTRWTIIISVVASLLAAIGALWITQGNMLAAFTAGIALRTETKETTPQPAPPPVQPSRPNTP